jgi:predicted nucleotidyltransferase
VVFGSVAELGTGNDLDILVILDGGEDTMDLGRARLNRCVRKFYNRFAVDPFAVSREMFNEQLMDTRNAIQLKRTSNL